MKQYLHVGDRWNRITLLDIHYEYPDANAIRKSRIYTFRCDCGQEFSKWSKDYRGKRSVRDCGKCGLASRDATGLPRLVRIQAYFPEPIVVALRQLSTQTGISVNKLILQCCDTVLELGMEQEIAKIVSRGRKSQMLL